MGTCRQCGQPVGPGARFCTGCGTAVTASPPRFHSGVIGALSATVTVLAGVAAFVVFAKPGVVVGIPMADPDFRPAVTVPAPSGSDEPPSVPTPDDTPTIEPVDAALAELQLIRDADRPTVESLVGQWVPQLSAKRPGMVVQGITYDYVEILRDYRETQASYPDALLVYSGEYTSFKYGDFWITIEPLPYYDGPSANGWCDGQGIPADNCYAKMISHTVGYEGATLLRGQ
jgi:hypothetical protein